MSIRINASSADHAQDSRGAAARARPVAQVIASWRAQAVPWREIAARLGVSLRTAYRLALDPATAPARLTPRQQQVAAEFDEPPAAVVAVARQQGCSWQTVAGICGVDLTTLIEWRHRWGQPVDRGAHRRDLEPLDSPHAKARRLGYEDAGDAIRQLRLAGLTVVEVAAQLGINRCTVSKYSPPEVRGLQNYGARHRAAARANIARNRRKPAANHPWRVTLVADRIIGGEPC